MQHFWNYPSIRSQMKYAMVILNHSINQTSAPYFKKLWCGADVHVCVDGGTNAFHKLIYSPSNGDKSDKNNPIPLPDFISGDFDSVEGKVKEYFKNLNVKITETPEQDETDFTKALKELNALLTVKEKKIDHVLVASGISTLRCDHVMGNINTLHKCASIISVPVILITDTCAISLLQPGVHNIRTIEYDNEEENWCAYVPFTGPTKVTTTGLKWDVEELTCEFGGMVSTSNKLVPDKDVVITTDKPLLWMMSYPADVVN